jgi:putative phosphoribosyl transferase
MLHAASLMASSVQKKLVRISSGSVQVEGMLELPADPIGMVLLAHGNGSSRFSSRHNYVAGVLRDSRFGTLLMDLLTVSEDQKDRVRFDIPLLSQRLDATVEWLLQYFATCSLPLGLFGASTGSAAALQVAAARKTGIAAIVSRSGRPDMAGHSVLEQINIPTLLIAGRQDDAVLELNQTAYGAIRCKKALEIIPGATGFFEEPGKLETVAALAAGWFECHLKSIAN